MDGQRSSAPSESTAGIPRWASLVVLVLGQVLLSLAIQELRILGLVQAAVLTLVGLYAVLSRNLSTLICVMAYVPGAEIVWRQVRSPVFYLAAPYLLTALSVFAVVIVLNRLGHTARLALLYAGLLLPAIIATIRTAGTGSRELIAFALSGPVALAALVAFTSQVKMSRLLYRRIMWTLLISSIGPLTIAAQSVRTQIAESGSIRFSSASNFVTSGGFGPVQVSSMLSMGAMAAVILIISESDRFARILAGVLAFVLVVQTLLTFSRGGSVSLAIAVTGLALVNANTPQVRNRILVVAGLTFALAYFLVFPWLESFTAGEFNQRFSDRESARTTIAANDIQVFRRNFVLGVGPGMVKYQRLTYEVCQLRSDRCRNEASSHTEFTRMLAEHGIPGVVAIGVMGLLMINSVRRPGIGRKLSMAWMLWAVSQMFYANLRISAVPLAFALAFLRFTEEQPSQGARPTEGDPSLRANDKNGQDHDKRGDAAAGERPIGFGAGYGPRGSNGLDEQRAIGFGAGRGRPNLIDRSLPDVSQLDPFGKNS